MKLSIKLTILALAVLSLTRVSLADTQCKTQKPINVGSQNAVIHGYDLVSYYGGSGPQLGKSEFAVTECGNTYLFESLENRTEFIENRDLYKLAFGGFNPFSMAFEAITDVNPEIYVLSGGEVHLFVNQTTKERYFKSNQKQIDAENFYQSL